MKDQMQYIVIEGRKPQDGAKPTQALLILPKWISPTLACAGIVGRVIELTDGNVIEQGAIPMDEQGMLEALREDMHLDTESQQEEVSPTAIDPNAIQPADDHVKECPLCALSEPEHNLGCPNKAIINVSQQHDDAYREGMQATRDKLAGLLLQFGMSADAKVPNWLKEELEELAQFRKDRPETLAKLQAAEDNLQQTVEYMNEGCICGRAPAPKNPVDPRLLAKEVDATDSRAEDQMQRALDQRDDEIERLRALLKGIRHMTKKANH